MKITNGWHLYANPVENDVMGPSQTVVEAWQAGKKLPSTAGYPEGTVVKDKAGDYRVYAGDVTLSLKLKAPPTGDGIEVRVKVAACSEGENARCLQPATVTLPAK